MMQEMEREMKREGVRDDEQRTGRSREGDRKDGMVPWGIEASEESERGREGKRRANTRAKVTVTSAFFSASDST
jgi:hypothetical protein